MQRITGHIRRIEYSIILCIYKSITKTFLLLSRSERCALVFYFPRALPKGSKVQIKDFLVLSENSILFIILKPINSKVPQHIYMKIKQEYISDNKKEQRQEKHPPSLCIG
jgi:hypothetical protein